jgi:hypothetical protein
MSEKSKRYASVNNPTINAVVHELYCLPTEELASEKLEQIRSHFIISTKQLNNATPSVHLWIKGFDVKPEQEAQGVIGNFAVVSYKKTDDTASPKWLLYATILDTPAQSHPQRAQVMRDNPNWGHPVMRSIRKGKKYKTLEEAQSELNLLHTQFPRVSIPNMGKLFIMIYCADRPAKSRMVKHILKIKLQPDASYTIECKENLPKEMRPKSDKKPNMPSVNSKESVEPKGFFTASVALRRHVKGKPKPTDPKA